MRRLISRAVPGSLEGVSPLLAPLLLARGVDTHDKLRAFLHPSAQDLYDPFLMPDMEKACRVEPLEEHIDNLCNALKHSHIDRLQNETCTLEHGFVFNDLLTNYERIGDHCSNIAVAMLEIKKDVFDTHEYLESLVNMKDEKFYRYFEEYQQKYQL